MKFKKILKALLKEIIQEADANPDFRARLETALGRAEISRARPAGKAAAKHQDEGSRQPKRPNNRRPLAVLDPVHLAKQGDDGLRAELSQLDIEQLRDIVADYGIDTSKLVTKWRDPERIIERIVEVARSRAQKGSAFRDLLPTNGSAIDRPPKSSVKKDSTTP